MAGILKGDVKIDDVLEVAKPSQISDEILFLNIHNQWKESVVFILSNCGSLKYVTFRTYDTDEYLLRNRISYGKYNMVPLYYYFSGRSLVKTDFEIEVEQNLAISFKYTDVCF